MLKLYEYEGFDFNSIKVIGFGKVYVEPAKWKNANQYFVLKSFNPTATEIIHEILTKIQLYINKIEHCDLHSVNKRNQIIIKSTDDDLDVISVLINKNTIKIKDHNKVLRHSLKKGILNTKVALKYSYRLQMAYWNENYWKECEECKECSKQYTNVKYKWCKPCKINCLKNNFTNWTSGNEKIDGFIQETQLQVNVYNDIIFEWLPFNQFCNIKKIGKGNFTMTVFSAIWKNGPLNYDYNKMELKRMFNKNVSLNFLQNMSVDEFLTKV
ncbi:hypothetical protein RhiirA4_467682 [Rhizophagus irregularis]|uniref:Protein kinase domain-containing protein n=1 Tax=Rhizophagus irregularis TaxID=588596 RepID=A0A2I1GWA8_9GLOM|nr:hypothetical protein RhiirA4_467682 [Rhizophagus irregularis]